MNDIASHEPAHPGYRLHKLEVYNWGTFDGCAYTIRLDGQTALLIGQNGSGKSTLVDALLTLLVQPAVRNFNVASGAQKRERDERTYVRGAFGRSSREDDNRAVVQYLRPGHTHYSALLACFRASADQVFTLVVLLHPTADGDIEKVYCYAPEERSLAEHCAGLASAERLKQQMEKRGFKATTKYVEYHGWFAKALGLRTKAMDVFNQTVAVKDIPSLNKFIREHMLEPQPWDEKVEKLLAHFTQLSEAHQSLVRVRRQWELLTPLAESGETYQSHAAKLQRAERLRDACGPFFRRKTVELFALARQEYARELAGVRAGLERIDGELSATREKLRQLKNEIDHAGGDRLRLIPALIDASDAKARAAREANGRYHDALRNAGIPTDVADAKTFADTQSQLTPRSRELDADCTRHSTTRDKFTIERHEVTTEIRNDEAELESLARRSGNLPNEFVCVRQQLCDKLRLSEKELPFVAELIAVRDEERDWEASAEKVLRSFALCLLVPERHYAAVSRYIDQNRLTDARGKGQRLHYFRVGESAASARGSNPYPKSLLRKLRYREKHALVPWVQVELAAKFDFVCCDTPEQFQAADAPAMTRQCHMKWRGNRHEKDDRDEAADPRRFVLGWDNAEKKARLKEAIRTANERRAAFDRQIAALDESIAALRARRTAIATAQTFANFGAIDFSMHEREVTNLQHEKKQLEEQNDTLKMLKTQITVTEKRESALNAERDAAIRHENDLTRDIGSGDRMIATAEKQLREWTTSGALARCADALAELESLTREKALTAVNLFDCERALQGDVESSVRKLSAILEPLKDSLLKSMSRYLREFPAERDDLDAGIEYLSSFLAKWEGIKRDDLPKHEQAFKERLNEKVTQEIALLSTALRNERADIVTKIEQLNGSLRLLEYRPGTRMQLDPRPVRDPEVTEFQSALRECLSQMYEDAPTINEARFLRIEKLIVRLRDDPRWRERVTDVRRWFDFAARESDTATGEERGYHEDSTGQSGGEKAKLAFTILVAAIAYQYDLDPARPASNRLRFVVVDEMFSKVDDQYAEYALQLFGQFGLQLLIVAPLDSKAMVTEPYVGCYLHVVKDSRTNRSDVFNMPAHEFASAVEAVANGSRSRPALRAATKSG